MGVQVQFKRRYIVFVNRKLIYFTDTHTLSDERGHLLGDEVTHMGFAGVAEDKDSTFILKAHKDGWVLR